MDFSIAREIATVIAAVFAAWGVMRERMLRLEIRFEAHEKNVRSLEESHEEHKERIYKRLEDIFSELQDIKLRMERNNVR